ncbi:hypothetical protein BDC45DRAFT_535716 [Circinella umbellata]|nr:hypothetical protein BDC45DRAFT_535716 [Circinella umbellata]
MDPQCFLDLFFEQMIKGASSSGIVVVITPRLKIACNYLILYEYEFIVEVVSTMLYLQYNVYAHKKLGMNLLINRSMYLHELTHFIEFHVNSDHTDSWKSIHFYYSF